MSIIFSKIKKLMEGFQDEHLEPLAEDPNTSPEQLEKWADHINPNIRKNVAVNPNTPPQTLFKLAAKGEKIDHNPVLPLIALEGPEHFSKINSDDVYHIAQYNRNPILSQMLYTHYPEKFVKGLVLNKATDPEFLDKSVNGADAYSLNMIASNENTAPETLRKLHSLNKENNGGYIHGCLAGNPNTPEDILDSYASNPNSQNIQKLVANPNLSNKIAHKILKHPNFWHDNIAIDDLTKNTNLSDDFLREFLLTYQNKLSSKARGEILYTLQKRRLK